MTTKDFEEIARILSRLTDRDLAYSGKEGVIATFARELKARNPKFNEAIFVKAANK